MNQKKRIILLLGGLVAITAVMFVIEYFRGISQAKNSDGELQPGDVGIYWNGKLDMGFSAVDLETLGKVSFTDNEDQKIQEGWLLKDILLNFYSKDQFSEDTVIRVSSSSRSLSATVIWDEVMNDKNFIMFDLSGRGTLKLVSVLERLDERAEWIQDVDKIEINPQ